MTDPPAIVKRHSRALRILSCLQSGPSFNARELASRLNVSRRTIYRDLNLIRAAGIDVVFDESHAAYRVETHRQIAPLRLEPEDLTRLLITSHLSPFASMSQDFAVSVRESMARLLSPYPDSVRGPIQRIINCCRIRPSVRDKRLSDLLQRILVGVGRGVQLRLVVKTFGKPLVITRFAPYVVEYDEAGRWRVTGRSSRHRVRQTFYLEDIEDVQLTNMPFELPRNNRHRTAASA